MGVNEFDKAGAVRRVDVGVRAVARKYICDTYYLSHLKTGSQ